MTTAAPNETARTGARGAVQVLTSARDARVVADAAEVQVLVDAVEWAALNPPVLGRDAAGWDHRATQGGRPERLALSADGVPEVDRAAVAELGLALGWSTQAALGLMADALELAYRLPMVWTRVVAGEVRAWRARQVAQHTRPLSRLAAGFVDRQIAPVAHRVTRSEIDRLVAAAVARFNPDGAGAGARECRGFEIHLDRTTLSGATPVSGVLDLPDALDVEAAIGHAATQLAAWGSVQDLPARRARALGDLAREHLTWHQEPAPSTMGAVRVDTGDQPGDTVTITPCDPTPSHDRLSGDSGSGSGGAGADPIASDASRTPEPRVPPRRQVVLYVHLTDTALRRATGRGDATSGPGSGLIGRVENTGIPVTADTVRTWCGDVRTTVIVRPVLDLAEPQRADTYEIPTRIKEQIRLRDGTCVFPGCHAPGLNAQVDHTVPYDHDDPAGGGQTVTGNLALLCQRHHNLKTHHGFAYTMLPGGAVLWRTPHGLTVHRHGDGRVDIDMPTPPHDPSTRDLPAGDPPEH